MKTYRKAKVILTVFLLFIIFSCESENIFGDTNIEYPISCLNKNAINFFNEAELKKTRGDLLGAKSDYESALRIDPSFIMAALNINEPDQFRKKNYIDVAIESQKEPTEYEKILIELNLANDVSKKRELADKLISRFPNISEPLFIKSSLYGNNRGDVRVNLLTKASKIKPNSAKILLSLFRSKYNLFAYGASNLIELGKNRDSLSSINDQINKIISTDTLNASMYRSFGDIFRYLDLKKCSEYYKKGLEVCNQQGNSFRAEMLITVAYAEYLNGGNFDEVLSIIEQAIDTEFDPLLKMKRYFQYHIISMFEKDYDNAIEILNRFEKDIRSFGFTPSMVNQTKVSIHNFRSVAHALNGSKDQSLKDLQLFKKFSNLVLIDIPDLDNNFINRRNRTLVGIVGGLDDRLIMARKENQNYFEIFVNILNENISEANKMINNSKSLSPIEIDNFNLLKYHRTKNFKKIFELFEDNKDILLGEGLQNSMYINQGFQVFIYANSLYENNYNPELIQKMLRPFYDVRGFGYGFNFFLKDVKELYESL